MPAGKVNIYNSNKHENMGRTAIQANDIDIGKELRKIILEHFEQSHYIYTSPVTE